MQIQTEMVIVTADERYSHCQTVKELNRIFSMDLRNAKSKAEEDEYNRMYAKHYKRVFILTMIKGQE